MTLSPLANGYILGWSVAWPPEPINAEMIRAVCYQRIAAADSGLPGRLVLARAPAISSGPLAFASAQGPLLNSVEIRCVLAIVSLALLLFLAVRFAIGAWKVYRAHRSVEFQAPRSERRGAFLFGLFVVLMSPWNVGFWPNWQVATEAIAAAVMLWFAIRLLLHFP